MQLEKQNTLDAAVYVGDSILEYYDSSTGSERAMPSPPNPQDDIETSKK
jgi:hypothetical protein